jgi:hypothetical protein
MDSSFLTINEEERKFLLPRLKTILSGYFTEEKMFYDIIPKNSEYKDM